MTDTCENCSSTYEVADYALNDGTMTLCEDCWVIKYERGKEGEVEERGGFFINGESVVASQITADTIRYGDITTYHDSVRRDAERLYATLN